MNDNIRLDGAPDDFPPKKQGITNPFEQLSKPTTNTEPAVPSSPFSTPSRPQTPSQQAPSLPFPPSRPTTQQPQQQQAPEQPNPFAQQPEQQRPAPSFPQTAPQQDFTQHRQHNEPPATQAPQYTSNEPSPSYAPQYEVEEEEESSWVPPSQRRPERSYETRPNEEYEEVTALVRKRKTTPPPVNQFESEDEDSEEEETKLSRKERRAAKKKKPAKKASRKKAPAGKNKPSDYAGDRKKVLWTRVAIIGVLVIVGGLGLKAIFIPETGPTPEQVQNVAKDAVGFTGFPMASGEQFALDFTKKFLNFDSKQDSTERRASLAPFVSESLYDMIELKTMSGEEFEELAIKDGEGRDVEYSDYSEAQEITYGPYVVAAEAFSEESALFTVKVGTNRGSVFYMNIPISYDPKNYSITLGGPPSFTKSIQNQGEVKEEDYTVSFEDGNDSELEDSLRADLEAYLTAWALSDETLMKRYTADNATDNATNGLDQELEFHSLDSLKIEAFNEDNPQTGIARRMELVVTWNDPDTNIRYTQQYRVLITLNQSDKWMIYDIQNFAALN